MYNISENAITCEETGLKYGIEKSKERLETQWRTGTVVGERST